MCRVKETKVGSSLPAADGSAPKPHSPRSNVSAKDDPVGNRLRDLFSAIESEGIPGRFLDLLEKLDTAERDQDPTKNTGGGKDGG
jgi:Anti-sigma factor NepR